MMNELEVNVGYEKEQKVLWIISVIFSSADALNNNISFDWLINQSLSMIRKIQNLKQFPIFKEFLK